MCVGLSGQKQNRSCVKAINELLQENFTSWDDMVANYTLGYQFWCDKRQKDRWEYYKKLKKTWIFKIAWNTELIESDIYEEFVVEEQLYIKKSKTLHWFCFFVSSFNRYFKTTAIASLPVHNPYARPHTYTQDE